jgi:glycosyltransferase involved in cell wall biosynthesis
MRAFNPDIVQGWMYHGNIAATVAVFLFDPMRRKVKLFWNVRQTLYDINSEKPQTRWLIVLGRWLSIFPNSIIYNSNLSADQHCNIGFPAKKTKIIANGFDLQKFKSDQQRRQQLHEELKAPESVLLVGHISRLHPMKDHATLLRAIDRVVDSLSSTGSKQEVLFLLIGHGVTSELSSNKSIRFLGWRSDIPEIMSALDIVVSSSAWGEGFPNVVGEAMASEVPCVVTDVGDSAYIVGKYGRVCSVGDDQCIANSLLQLIDNKEERKIAGRQARKRINENYSMDKIKKEYLKEWGF